MVIFALDASMTPGCFAQAPGLGERAGAWPATIDLRSVLAAACWTVWTMAFGWFGMLCPDWEATGTFLVERVFVPAELVAELLPGRFFEPAGEAAGEAARTEDFTFAGLPVVRATAGFDGRSGGCFFPVFPGAAFLWPGVRADALPRRDAGLDEVATDPAPNQE